MVQHSSFCCPGRLLAAFDCTYLLQVLSQFRIEGEDVCFVGGRWNPSCSKFAAIPLTESEPVNPQDVPMASDMLPGLKIDK